MLSGFMLGEGALFAPVAGNEIDATALDELPRQAFAILAVLEAQ